MMIMFPLTRYKTNSQVWLEHDVGKNTDAIIGLVRKMYTEHFIMSDSIWDWTGTQYMTRGSFWKEGSFKVQCLEFHKWMSLPG